MQFANGVNGTRNAVMHELPWRQGPSWRPSCESEPGCGNYTANRMKYDANFSRPGMLLTSAWTARGLLERVLHRNTVYINWEIDYRDYNISFDVYRRLMRLWWTTDEVGPHSSFRFV